MPNQAGQADLFGGGGWCAPPPQAAATPPEAVQALDDAALLAAIRQAGQRNCGQLGAEIAARRLTEAVPALDELCRRFKGFGRENLVREQVVALETLTVLGGVQAANVVERLITERIIEGPGLENAFAAAAALKVRLPADIVEAALHAESPSLRALACRCARFCPRAAPRLRELLEDPQSAVASEAAITLGQLGHGQAKPQLLRLLDAGPTAEMIEALAAIEDEDCFVQLGRLAALRPELRPAVCAALADIDHPRAGAILRRLAAG
jgi:HEAT repeat protein